MDWYRVEQFFYQYWQAADETDRLDPAAAISCLLDAIRFVEDEEPTAEEEESRWRGDDTKHRQTNNQREK